MKITFEYYNEREDDIFNCMYTESDVFVGVIRFIDANKNGINLGICAGVAESLL